MSTRPRAARVLPTSAARFDLEVHVRAPRDHVWRTVVERPEEWWIPEIRCVPGGSRMRLEARPGGRLVEENAEGAGLVWFEVVSVEPQRSLNLAGVLAPPFGGPCQTFLLVELEARGEETVVRMTHSLHGHVDENLLPELERGWKAVLENGIKAVAEGARVA